MRSEETLPSALGSGSRCGSPKVCLSPLSWISVEVGVGSGVPQTLLTKGDLSAPEDQLQLSFCPACLSSCSFLLSSSPIFYLTLLILAWSSPFHLLPLLPFPSPFFSTLSSLSSHPFCSACVTPLLGNPPCLLLSIFPDPCLCFFSSASLSLPPGPLRPGSDDAGVLVPQPFCPPHCTADQEDTSETQQQSGEAQNNSLAHWPDT